MSKQEIIPSAQLDSSQPVFVSELSQSSVSFPLSPTDQSRDSHTLDEKILQSPAPFRKGIEIQFTELTYDEKKPIGRGAYGQVYQGTFRREPVAIKIYDFRGSLSSEEKQAVMFEAQTMDQLRSKYLIGLRGIFFEPHYGLVMEYCAGGTLAQLLKKPEITIDFAQQLQWGIQISYGLHALHSVHIFHRDLKGDNILLDQSREAKIGDFGLAQIKSASASQSKHVDHSAAGTIPWMAPELFDKKPHTSAADMYSLGMVLWEIVSRQSPFHGIMPFVIIGTVLAGKRETIPPGCPKIFEDLVTACWDVDPSKRPSAEMVGDQFYAAWRSVSGLPPVVSESKQRALVPSIEPIFSNSRLTSLIPKIKREPTREERLLSFFYVEKGDKNALENLLKDGISPDITNENGFSLLQEAAENGKDDIAKLLLDYTATVNLLKEKSTPLHSAISGNNPNVVRLLLAYKAEVDLAAEGCATAFIFAVKLMPQQWDDKQKKVDIEGQKNLYAAMKILLDSKADVNKNIKGNIPLCMALEYSWGVPGKYSRAYRIATASLLIEYKANIHDLPVRSYVHAMHLFSPEGTKIVKTFLESKLDINQVCGKEKETLFCKAVSGGYSETIELLLSRKADINYKDVYNRTPIFYAIDNLNSCDEDLRSETEIIIHLLLKSNADLNIKSERVIVGNKEHKDCTPLIFSKKLAKYYPSFSENQKIFKLIECHEKEQGFLSIKFFTDIQKGDFTLTKNALENKVVVDRANKEGHSPLFIAAQKGFPLIVKLLLEYNAKVNQAKQPGMTPLATAAFRGHLEVVRILLEAKADPTLKTDLGETPLQQASKQGHHGVAALLQPSSGQESWREEKYNNPLVVSSSGSSSQSVNLPLVTEIIPSSSSSISSSAIAVTSSSSSTSVSTPVVSSKKTSTPTVAESKTSITDTPGTLFSTPKPKSKNGDDGLRQPLIKKSQETDDSGKRCCPIL